MVKTTEPDLCRAGDEGCEEPPSGMNPPHRPMHSQGTPHHPITKPPRPCLWSRLRVLNATRLWAGFLILTVLCTASLQAASDVVGAPLTRHYAFEEVANMSRGARIGFDSFGRLTVIQNGAAVVLNDNAWVELVDRSEGLDVFGQLAYAPDGTLYYGALGSWGEIERTPNGRWRTVPLRPEITPEWVPASNFTKVVPTREATYFSGWSGVVVRETASGRHTFFEIKEVAHIFALDGRGFVSSRRAGVQTFDVGAGVLLQPEPEWRNQVLIDTAALPDGRLVGSTPQNTLVVFDGTRFSSWADQFDTIWKDGITAIQSLKEGGTAVAVQNRGLFLLDTHGDLTAAYDLPDYHGIQQLATNEPGILWATTDAGILRIAYGCDATLVDQRMGVPIKWPQVVRWRGKTLIATDGQLYEASAKMPGAISQFTLVQNQPPRGLWGIASKGPNLLVGTSQGVFAANDQGGFDHVLDGFEVGRLVMVDPELCFVISSQQITALRLDGGHWHEFTPRIPGLGYPMIVHAAGKAVWIELGVNRVARLALKNGALATQLFDEFPWPGKFWVNVSVIDNIVLMRAKSEQRMFFDETTESFITGPAAITRLLDQAPYSLIRIAKDSHGTVWASHSRGMLRFDKQGDDYQLAHTTLGLVHENTPGIHQVDGDDIWWYSAAALYHAEPRTPPASRRPLSPVLISIVDSRSGQPLTQTFAEQNLPRLSHAQNSLDIEVFAGSYSISAPSYEFRLTRDGDAQTVIRGNFRLSLPELREGHYTLEARLAETLAPTSGPLQLTFDIAPPWWRTWPTYAVETLLGLGAIAALIALIGHRQRARTAMLEKLVQARTSELRSTMQQLNEETRHAAILAERDRLAGEIHDSIQQGLSGLMLQIDATLRLSDISQEVRSRLNVARNMVSFTRQEVQQAVWDLASPLLENGDLGAGLQKIATLVDVGGPRITTTVTGIPHPLPQEQTHHLLRIAQEAITNAIRHAHATRIDVRLEYAANSVTLTVRDDGCGFNPANAMAGGLGHFGLRGIRARATKIDGVLQVTSTQESPGTTIKIVVPTP